MCCCERTFLPITSGSKRSILSLSALKEPATSRSDMREGDEGKLLNKRGGREHGCLKRASPVNKGIGFSLERSLTELSVTLRGDLDESPSACGEGCIAENAGTEEPVGLPRRIGMRTTDEALDGATEMERERCLGCSAETRRPETEFTPRDERPRCVGVHRVLRR